ncbi:MAG: PDZ domain-containing protein [Deltaproteobacteria bacterium]|nr:PDZ domain-containing protein [Deltaproteobacteria bacterium]
MLRFYNIILPLLVLTVVIYTGVDIFYKVVAAKFLQVDSEEIVAKKVKDIEPDQKLLLSDYKTITERNLFGSVEKASSEGNADQIGGLKATSLNIALLGTVSGDKRDAFAVIEDVDKREQGLYRVGDSVQNAVVKMILRGKIVLRIGGKDEILTMDEPKSRPEPVKPKKRRPLSKKRERRSTVTINRSKIRGSLKNINDLLSQVQVSPHSGDGKGLSITQIAPDSIFSELKLKDGDIIRGVNGKTLKEPDDLISLYRRLKSGFHVSLQITRNGKRKTINYRFR